jgi:branched-chain amino acid transport system ATP-binding protein
VALEVHGLSKHFAGLVAVADVSFAVRPGEIVGIIGPNGSGKTTLLSMLAGLLAPTSGSVLWKGREIQDLRPDIIAGLGVVKTFQNPQVFAELSVFDNVQVASHLALKRSLGLRRGLEVVGAARDVEQRLASRAGEVLALCDLGGAARQLAGSLSYGEEKMLGIAMGLMCDPELLLLDEPASGLGRDEVRNLEAVLAKVHAAGTTLCLVDHKIGFLRGLADRVIALNYGRKIAEGTPEQVLNEAAVVEAYLGAGHARA